MLCPKCNNNNNPENSKFCEKCGTPIGSYELNDFRKKARIVFQPLYFYLMILPTTFILLVLSFLFDIINLDILKPYSLAIMLIILCNILVVYVIKTSRCKLCGKQFFYVQLYTSKEVKRRYFEGMTFRFYHVNCPALEK